MAYTPKPGQGTLNRNRFKESDDDGKPTHKGYLILPDGSVVGLAQWKVETKNGHLLSLKVDDSEGAYWAKQLNRQHTNGEAQQNAGGDRQRDSRDDQRKHSQPHSNRPSARSRHADDDLDDEIPF